MKIEKYQKIPPEAIKIRTDVFIKEQGFKDEFDHIDDKAIHLVLFNPLPVATCRIYFNQENNFYAIGRIAVTKEYRKQGYGQIILDQAHQEIKKLGYNKTYLLAQTRAKPFYQKLGYNEFGPIIDDEGVDHIWMVKTI